MKATNVDSNTSSCESTGCLIGYEKWSISFGLPLSGVTPAKGQGSFRARGSLISLSTAILGKGACLEAWSQGLRFTRIFKDGRFDFIGILCRYIERQQREFLFKKGFAVILYSKLFWRKVLSPSSMNFALFKCDVSLTTLPFSQFWLKAWCDLRGNSFNKKADLQI